VSAGVLLSYVERVASERNPSTLLRTGSQVSLFQQPVTGTVANADSSPLPRGFFITFPEFRKSRNIQADRRQASPAADK
jgi:hypothetical protein